MKFVGDARVEELFLSAIHARFFLSWAIAEEGQRPNAPGIVAKLLSANGGYTLPGEGL